MANQAPERFVIKNDFLEVEIKKLGAELCSVKDKQGTEFIWQAEEVWPRHAPNLFPVIGSMLDLEYVCEGKTYSMPHHGFARNLDFDMVHQSEHSIALLLQQSEETLKYYPFHFTLLISYTLSENSLKQTFRVINTSDNRMPVSFGGHPAFNAKPIQDFDVLFSENENRKSNRLEGPYVLDVELDLIQNQKISLDKNTFDNDALIFQGLNSKVVTLANKTSNYSVEVDISEFPYLGIWAKPGADYVCIEPWQGLADFVSHDKKIENKKGIIWVEKSKEISKSFTMTFTN
ncbi:MAG: hypothetical protein RLZZ337_1151 [Bacteroidota bacterium]|jgi:galactose mutarotase-like enzyme